jgi:hypothetical protein
MQQNNVQTLIDYAKDLSGQSNAATAKVIRALNFGTDSLSTIKLLAASKTNPDSSNQTDVSRSTVTTSDSTLGVYGGTIAQDELVSFLGIEILGSNGTYTKLTPTDIRSDDYQTLQSQSGTPTHFDLSGQLIRPLPAPDASYTYRLSYGRAHPRFSASNLTQTTGLLPLEEEYVATFAADKLMVGSSDPMRSNLRNDLVVLEGKIEKMVTSRDQITSRTLQATIAPAFSRNSFKRT